MEAWASAHYVHGNPEASAQLNAKALGKVHCIEEILDVNHEVINQSKEPQR